MEAPQVAAVGEVALPAAGTAATAATSEAAATAAGGGETVRVELGTEVETEAEVEAEAVVPPEVTAIQAPAACNRATYHAPRE